MSISRPLRIVITLLSAFIVAGVTTLVAASATGILSSADAGGKGGCGSGPIQCTTTLTDAQGNWFVELDPEDNLSLTVDVFRGDVVIRPHNGGAAFEQESTIVQTFLHYGLNGVGFQEFGCFIVPDSDFVVSRDLQTATLMTTLTADETCPGFVVSVASLNGPTPNVGCCFQPGDDTLLPITLNLSWTGLGSAFTTISDSTTHCLGFVSTAHTTDSVAMGTATGTVSTANLASVDLGQSGPFTFVESLTSVNNVNGQPSPQCSF